MMIGALEVEERRVTLLAADILPPPFSGKRVNRMRCSSRILLLPLALVLVLAQAQSNGSATAEVVLFPDGWVDVTVTVRLNETSAGLIIRLDGEPHNLMVVNEGGIPLNYSLDGPFLIVETLGSREITISYQTPSLTSKSGVMWNLTLDLDVDKLVVVVPSQLVIVGLSKLPDEISPAEGGLRISFSGGTASLSYKVVHKPTKKQSLHEENFSSSEPHVVVSSSVEATFTGPSEESSGVVSPESQVQGPASKSLLPLIAGGIVLASAASVILLRSRKGGTADYLKEGSLEYKILRELERRGGMAKQADIIRAVQAPRTTVWRKIRRLEEKGFVEVRREGEATLVMLRANASTTSPHLPDGHHPLGSGGD